MNAQNVYDLIKESITYFGLEFNQMYLINVMFDKDSITMSYENRKITVDVDK